GDEQVNFVNAPLIARQRGIRVREVTSEDIENFANLVTLKIRSGQGTHSLAGTVFSRNDIRITQIDDYRIEVMPSPYMLVCYYLDRPGVIGRVGTILGSREINIAGMQVGRQSAGGEAVMVLQIDEPATPSILQEIEQLEEIKSIRQVQLRGQDMPAVSGD
ncbi:MAG: ACT domain-containing protein, partial [Firmicutes bacterium]|nr:ACT domain-containing protein [Bacillota bacterium]